MQLWHKVVLEINSDCNRSCSFCNRHGDNKNRFFDENGKRINKFMPMDKIENIRQQLVDMGWHGKVLFGHMSEPTLDERLCEVITMFKDSGFHTTLHSNGDIMKRDKKLCESLSLVCDEFIIGIYNTENKTDIETSKQWWTQRLSPRLPVRFSVSTVRFQRRFSLGDGTHTEYSHENCVSPTNNLVIYYDGKVALCCEDINCDFDLGNVFDTQLIDIWTSEHRKEIVSKLRQTRKNYKVCAECPIVSS